MTVDVEAAGRFQASPALLRGRRPAPIPRTDRKNTLSYFAEDDARGPYPLDKSLVASIKPLIAGGGRRAERDLSRAPHDPDWHGT